MAFIRSHGREILQSNGQLRCGVLSETGSTAVKMLLVKVATLTCQEKKNLFYGIFEG